MDPLVHRPQRQLLGRRRRPRVPDSQRRRVKLACRECRKHKLRCDGSSPCARCNEASRLCRYDPDYPPTVSIGQHQADAAEVQTVREQLQLLRQIFAKTYPDVPCDLSSLRSFYSDLTGRDSTFEGEASSRHDPVCYDGYPHLHGHVSSGDRSSPGHAASMTVISQGKTHFEGDSSLWCFFRSVRLAFEDASHEDDGNGEAGCGGTKVHLNYTSFGIDWKSVVMQALPPRDVVDFLVDTFFQLAQTNYFCVHPEIFSRKLNAFYQGTHEFESHDATATQKSVEFLAVLFMVLAIGSQFADVGNEAGMSNAASQALSLELSDLTLPQNISRIKVPTPAQNPGWPFYEVSRRLLPDIISLSSMATIQVCLLQGIYLPSTTSRDAGYNLLGLALRMAINMGLHRSFDSSSLHRDVLELRNRLWWSVYVADRLYSIEMGRPLAISDSEIDAPFPADIPRWSGGKWKNIHRNGLIALVKISGILGKIVDAVYCKATSKDGATIRPKVLQELKAELAQWKQSLPEDLHLEGFTTRAEAHLALTHEQAIILLTRSCLQCCVTAGCQPNLVQRAEANGFIQQQAQECVSAAIKSIHILSTLDSRSLLCHFSFHDSLYCSSALYVLLFAMRKLGKVVHVPRHPVSQGIRVLMELSKGSEAAALSLKGIIRVLKHQVIDKHTGVLPTEESGQMKGRSAWRAWRTSTVASRTDSDVNLLISTDSWNEPRSVVDPASEAAPRHLDAQLSSTDEGGPLSDQVGSRGEVVGTASDHDDMSSLIEGMDIAPFCVPEHLDFDFLCR